MLALCDLISAVVFAVLLSRIDQGKEASWLLAWNHARALVLVAIGVSRRIRERAWVVGTCCIVSLISNIACSVNVLTDHPVAAALLLERASTTYPDRRAIKVFDSFPHLPPLATVIQHRALALFRPRHRYSTCTKPIRSRIRKLPLSRTRSRRR